MRMDLIKLFRNGECILEHDSKSGNKRFHEIAKAVGMNASGISNFYYKSNSGAYQSNTDFFDVDIDKRDKPIYTVDEFFKNVEINNYEIF